jgi:3-deoxy-D-manno-octulosonate 8-phosphate phosphatase (KDO 8-P phosphatase)
MDSNYKQRLKDISTFIFDVDGVLTDGTLLIMPDGEQLRRMNIKDGYALQLAVKKGYRVAIISGKKNEGVIKRLHGLGIKDLYMGVQDKEEALDEYLHLCDLATEKTLYMGDDIPDYGVMRRVGIAACPADACHEIKSISHHVSSYRGGEGCVRDVIEQVLRVQGQWEIA